MFSRLRAAYLIKFSAKLPLQQVRVSFEERHQEPTKSADVETVSLGCARRTFQRQARLGIVMNKRGRAHLQGLFESEYYRLDCQKRVKILA